MLLTVMFFTLPSEGTAQIKGGMQQRKLARQKALNVRAANAATPIRRRVLDGAARRKTSMPVNFTTR